MIELFDLPANEAGLIVHLKNKNTKISLMAVRSKRLGRIVTADDKDGEGNLARYDEIRKHLRTLEAVPINMNHRIRNASNMEMALRLICDHEDMYFPADIVAMAQGLLYKWTAEDWGSNPDSGEEEEIPVPASTGPIISNERDEDGALTVRWEAPEAGSVFAEGGILYGVLINTRGGSTRMRHYIMNPAAEKKPAQVFGHNGLTPGDWFPLQLVALVRGAHGASRAGISGSIKAGAYSIVVANTYEDLDKDEGNVLYYSGSGSHDNEDPTRVGTQTAGTKSLIVSLATRNPVRVLRNGGSTLSPSRGAFAPDCGLRYDGLYEVVAHLTPKNGKGGLYDQFKLVRRSGQESLAKIGDRSPTTEQRMAWKKYQRGE